MKANSAWIVVKTLSVLIQRLRRRKIKNTLLVFEFQTPQYLNFKHPNILRTLDELLWLNFFLQSTPKAAEMNLLKGVKGEI